MATKMNKCRECGTRWTGGLLEHAGLCPNCNTRNDFTRTLPTGEFVEVSEMGDGFWQAVVWGSESDYDLDQKEAGEWADRATFSVAGTLDEVLSEVRP